MFEHKQLDGEKIRVLSAGKAYLKAEILEIRDPKNNNSNADACRSQYGAIGETLVERYLPPQSKGDSWQQDSSASPWWSVVGHPPHGGIVADFNKYIGGAYLRKLDPTNNVVAFAEEGEAVSFDGQQYSVTRTSDTQELRGSKIAELRQQYYN